MLSFANIKVAIRVYVFILFVYVCLRDEGRSKRNKCRLNIRKEALLLFSLASVWLAAQSLIRLSTENMRLSNTKCLFPQ